MKTLILLCITFNSFFVGHSLPVAVDEEMTIQQTYPYPITEPVVDSIDNLFQALVSLYRSCIFAIDKYIAEELELAKSGGQETAMTDENENTNPTLWSKWKLRKSNATPQTNHFEGNIQEMMAYMESIITEVDAHLDNIIQYLNELLNGTISLPEIMPPQTVETIIDAWSDLQFSINQLTQDVDLFRSFIVMKVEYITNQYEEGSTEWHAAMKILYHDIEFRSLYWVKDVTPAFRKALTLPRGLYFQINLETFYMEWPSSLNLPVDATILDNMIQSKSHLDVIYNANQVNFFLSITGKIISYKWAYLTLLLQDSANIKRLIDQAFIRGKQVIQNILTRIEEEYLQLKNYKDHEFEIQQLKLQIENKIQILIDFTETSFRRINSLTLFSSEYFNTYSTNLNYNGAFQTLLFYLEEHNFGIQWAENEFADCYEKITIEFVKSSIIHDFSWQPYSTGNLGSINPKNKLLSIPYSPDAYYLILHDKVLYDIIYIYQSLLNNLRASLPQNTASIIILLNFRENAIFFVQAYQYLRLYITQSGLFIDSTFTSSSQEYEDMLCKLSIDVGHRIDILSSQILESFQNALNYRDQITSQVLLTDENASEIETPLEVTPMEASSTNEFINQEPAQNIITDQIPSTTSQRESNRGYINEMPINQVPINNDIYSTDVYPQENTDLSRSSDRGISTSNERYLENTSNINEPNLLDQDTIEAEVPNKGESNLNDYEPNKLIYIDIFQLPTRNLNENNFDEYLGKIPFRPIYNPIQSLDQPNVNNKFLKNERLLPNLEEFEIPISENSDLNIPALNTEGIIEPLTTNADQFTPRALNGHYNEKYSKIPLPPAISNQSIDDTAPIIQNNVPSNTKPNEESISEQKNLIEIDTPNVEAIEPVTKSNTSTVENLNRDVLPGHNKINENIQPISATPSQINVDDNQNTEYSNRESLPNRERIAEVIPPIIEATAPITESNDLNEELLQAQEETAEALPPIIETITPIDDIDDLNKEYLDGEFLPNQEEIAEIMPPIAETTAPIIDGNNLNKELLPDQGTVEAVQPITETTIPMDEIDTPNGKFSPNQEKSAEVMPPITETTAPIIDNNGLNKELLPAQEADEAVLPITETTLPVDETDNPNGEFLPNEEETAEVIQPIPKTTAPIINNDNLNKKLLPDQEITETVPTVIENTIPINETDNPNKKNMNREFVPNQEEITEVITPMTETTALLNEGNDLNEELLPTQEGTDEEIIPITETITSIDDVDNPNKEYLKEEFSPNLEETAKVIPLITETMAPITDNNNNLNEELLPNQETVEAINPITEITIPTDEIDNPNGKLSPNSVKMAEVIPSITETTPTDESDNPNEEYLNEEFSPKQEEIGISQPISGTAAPIVPNQGEIIESSIPIIKSDAPANNNLPSVNDNNAPIIENTTPITQNVATPIENSYDTSNIKTPNLKNVPVQNNSKPVDNTFRPSFRGLNDNYYNADETEILNPNALNPSKEITDQSNSNIIPEITNKEIISPTNDNSYGEYVPNQEQMNETQLPFNETTMPVNNAPAIIDNATSNNPELKQDIETNQIINTTNMPTEEIQPDNSSSEEDNENNLINLPSYTTQLIDTNNDGIIDKVIDTDFSSDESNFYSKTIKPIDLNGDNIPDAEATYTFAISTEETNINESIISSPTQIPLNASPFNQNNSKIDTENNETVVNTNLIGTIDLTSDGILDVMYENNITELTDENTTFTELGDTDPYDGISTNTIIETSNITKEVTSILNFIIGDEDDLPTENIQSIPMNGRK